MFLVVVPSDDEAVDDGHDDENDEDGGVQRNDDFLDGVDDVDENLRSEEISALRIYNFQESFFDFDAIRKGEYDQN